MHSRKKYLVVSGRLASEKEKVGGRESEKESNSNSNSSERFERVEEVVVRGHRRVFKHT